jgi:hypothetical protein
MSVEIGEAREKWSADVIELVTEFAHKMKHVKEPFYIVFHAKADKGYENTFRQTIKAYYERPPFVLGLLVWYVDHKKSEISFVPELSSPPDVPLDPNLLSDKAEDAFSRVMAQGDKAKILLS